MMNREDIIRSLAQIGNGLCIVDSVMRIFLR
jgi:hypothetical protein